MPVDAHLTSAPAPLFVTPRSGSDSIRWRWLYFRPAQALSSVLFSLHHRPHHYSRAAFHHTLHSLVRNLFLSSVVSAPLPPQAQAPTRNIMYRFHRPLPSLGLTSPTFCQPGINIKTEELQRRASQHNHITCARHDFKRERIQCNRPNNRLQHDVDRADHLLTRGGRLSTTRTDYGVSIVRTIATCGNTCLGCLTTSPETVVVPQPVSSPMGAKHTIYVTTAGTDRLVMPRFSCAPT